MALARYTDQMKSEFGTQTTPPEDERWRRAALTELYGPDAAAEIETRVSDSLRARLNDAASDDNGCASEETEPVWDQRDTWLIAYPDHFTDGDEPTLETLRRVLSVDFASAFNGVHVLPFHPASSDRGFSVEDYARVATPFGDWDDVKALATDHRLMADAVINHLSAESTWFSRFLAGEAPYDRYFRTASPDADLSTVVRPRTSPLLTLFETAAGPRWVWTTFSPDQVDLDYQEPNVLIDVMDALARYIESGADALRLDAIAFLWKQEGTPSIHQYETHLIIQIMRSWFDEFAPRVLVVTETNVPHVENMSYLNVGGRREAQAVYQFALPPLVLHTARSGHVDALVDWFGSLEPLAGDRTVLNFLASHDGVGVRPVESLLGDDDVEALARLCVDAGGAVNLRSVPGSGERPYELCSTWYSLMQAIDGDAEHGLQRHLATYAVCLAAAGIPLIYANAFLAVNNDAAAFANSGHARDLNRAGFDLDELRALLADEASTASRCARALTTMIAWRRDVDAFAPGAKQHVRAIGPAALQIERTGATTEAIVAVNFGDQPVDALVEGAWRRRVEMERPDDTPTVAARGIGWWDRLRHR